ncbi:glycyl radical protein [Caproiciproducens sp.]
MAIPMDSKQVEAIVSQVMQQLNSGKNAPAKKEVGQSGHEKLGTGGMEPFDLDYNITDYALKADTSPYPRINRILHRVHVIEQAVDDERAMLVTEAYKDFQGPQIIKCAKALENVLNNVTIHIWPDEIVVGEMAAPPRCAPVFPEFSYDWCTDELQNKPWDNRASDRFALSKEAEKNLLSIGDFWKGKTVEDAVIGTLTDEEIKGSSAYGQTTRPVFHPNLYLMGGIGHTTPRYQKLFQYGYKGLKQLVVEQMVKLDASRAEDIEKREFYTAQLICLNATINFFLRYSKLAKEMAEKESDGTRKAELLQMSENLAWVSENPPRTFWEAIQLYHLATNVILIESNGHSISYGRFDQLLYPYYEKDMKENKITKQFSSELIENFFIKVFELAKLRDETTAILNSEVGMGGTCLIVGGQDKDGRDATNDLTYLALEAHAHTQTPDPWFAVRWHVNAPWEFKVKVVNVIKVGTGQPKIFSDECIIPNMISAGRTLEESRDYTVVGCVELDTGGLEYSQHDADYFSMAKALELAINDGRCIDCGPECPRWENCGKVGGRLGPATGSLVDFKSIEEVKKAYEIQTEYWVSKMVAFMNANEMGHRDVKPLPYLSLLIENCVEKGVEVNAGGAKYNFTGPQGVGMATVGDGMCTIQQLVFEEKKITGEELLKALRANWKGYEALYTLINSDKVRHFGNDDDLADSFTQFASDVYCEACEKHRNSRGGKILPGLYSVSGNVGIGLVQGASPDGRIAKEPVSNSLAPVHTVVGCHDFKGPTAMAKSVAKINQYRATNGALLNVRFSPGCVSGATGRDNFVHYIDAYFARHGMHCQFNIVNRETLRDAQRHPENYPGLLVRVAGYSAYFVRLSKELQDDLIGRNEYSSFD